MTARDLLLILSTTVFYNGVHVAPSDARRVYVTGQTFGTTTGS